jgi:hypothetical protein
MTKERADDEGKGDASVETGREKGTFFIIFSPATTFHVTVALSFVIPSEAEGSAVPRTSPGNVFRPIAVKRSAVSATSAPEYNAQG